MIFTKIIDRIFAVSGALLFMQAPQFIQNYTQIMAGHLHELNYQLGQMRIMTDKTGKSIIELTAKFLKSTDPDIHVQGQWLEALIERHKHFQQAFTSLTHASPLAKPVIFAKYVQWDLFKETIDHFSPGIPLSVEGIAWAFCGLFAGYYLFRLMARIGKLFSFKKATT